jgi:hypothetical protein
MSAVPLLFKLPEELLLRIIAPLDLQSIYACLASCKYLQALSLTSAIVRYSQLAQFMGMVDNTLCPEVIAHRLQHLQDQDRGWRQLQVLAANTKTIPLPHSPSGIYDLTGGYYFLGETDGIPTLTRPRGATNALRFFNLADAFNPHMEISAKEYKHDHDHNHEHKRGKGEDRISHFSPKWGMLQAGDDIVDIGINVEEHDLVALVTT